MTDAGSDESRAAGAAWHDALLAAACIAVDPQGLGGVRVRAAAGPVRDAWLARWKALLPTATPIRQVPLHVDDQRLLGGLDLAASLRTGRPVEQPGVLAQVDGGYAILAMAERIGPATASRIAAAVETGDAGRGTSSRFALVAFDEGIDDEGLADVLAERLAIDIDLRGCSLRTIGGGGPDGSAASVEAARRRLAGVAIDDEVVAALCEAADALGIASLRMPSFALRVARAAAALDGRDAVSAADATRAARLVYASRARRIAPVATPDEQATGQRDEAADDRHDDPVDDARDAAPDAADDAADDVVDAAADAAAAAAADDRPLAETILEATVAAIPAGLLRALAEGAAARRAPPARGGGAGALGRGRRGASAGVRRTRPRPPERLALVETLRAAAPWQRLRRAERPSEATARVRVRIDDLHVRRFRQRHPTTTIFVVDASGSAALHRLAEAKGAVELLLADCYVRRDSVAVLAFRGGETTLLLPPTRSLVRARRSLAGLPGGGGTPLASALDATRELVVALRRRGETALAVLLTDGRANVARDGRGGRPQAEADALQSARALRALDVDLLLIDTSPHPHPLAARLAETMGALYRPLPHGGAVEMSAIVNRAARGRSPAKAART